MKKLLTMMTVCCMLMLTGCSKSDDGGTDTPQVTDPTTQAGTWISTNTLNEVELAMTFYGDDHVLINLEGLWFFGTMALVVLLATSLICSFDRSIIVVLTDVP